MTLMLHAGATNVDYDELRALETPPATATHVPIPHFRVVDLIKTALGMYGHTVTSEAHGINDCRGLTLGSASTARCGVGDDVGMGDTS